ncbi:MAG TPA: AMP-binding protein [Stellaceae bacterium]|nr:AMP-binding protein [Stellaceae bacterium]
MPLPTPYFDALEVRDPAAREAALMAALPGVVAAAKAHAPAYGRMLAQVDPQAVKDRRSLAQLPVTRKSALLELQRHSPPFGGFAAVPIAELAQVFASPGPIYEPGARRADYFRLARALYAAGFRKGELIHNAFSYHLTPAGMMAEGAAAALGCPVIPGGTGQTELQLRTIADLKPAGYVGTPSFLKILFDRAAAMELDISSLEKALVGAEALPASLRAEIEAHGLGVLQCYGSADLGLIAYETRDAEGRIGEGMLLDEGIIVEIVEPLGTEPVAPGEIGEVVVTTLSPEYPLIRFATGDLSAILPGQSACGRTNHRIRGWLGRADQTTKVRGLFVHPEAIAELRRRHPAIRRARLLVERVDNADRMTLLAELAEAGDTTEIAASLQALTKLRGEVRGVPPGSLPEDGKLIEDRRPL